MSFAPVGAAFDGELDGLAWDGAAMLVCALATNEIHRYDPVSDAATVARRQTVRTRGLAFGPDGRLYGAQGRARRIVWYRADGAAYYVESTVDGMRRNDPQHLAIDRAGRIWSTDRWTEESSGGPVGLPPLAMCSVLRLDPVGPRGPAEVGTWTLRRMTTDTVAPHGIALSRDERTLYVTDGGDATVPPTLRGYGIRPDGSLSAGAALRRFDEGDRPAGMCADAAGLIAVAVGGPRPLVEIVDARGQVARTEAVPAAPTACAFGGSDLYVTTVSGQLLRGSAQGGMA